MGKIAMMQRIYYSVHVINEKFPDLDYDVVFPPKKVSRACYYDPNALVITKNIVPEKREAACTFLKFYLSYEVQKRVAGQIGGLPASKKAAEDMIANHKGKPENIRIFYEILEESVDMDVNKNWKQMIDILGMEFDLLMLGKKNAEDVSQDAHRKIQVILEGR